MTLNLFGALANLFGGHTMSANYRKDLMTWAKTEYSNDWEFAYTHMIENGGRAPSHTYTQGIH